MRRYNKPVKTKDAALTNDIKEIVLAKISTKQAIMVAIISLLSAIAVATIANLDKIRSSTNVVNEETGHYEGRASTVERAFLETEEELQSRSKLAQRMGKLDIANHLNKLVDEVRRNHAKFQELHSRHIDAVQNGKRLSASKIKTEANEVIWELDQKLLEEDRLGPEDWRRRVTEFEKIVSEKRIPLYGKQAINDREQVCKLSIPVEQ